MSVVGIGVVAMGAVLIAIAALVVVTRASYSRPSEHIEQNLAGREEVEIEEVLADRFATGNIDLEAAAELWKSLAECYSVHPGLEFRGHNT